MYIHLVEYVNSLAILGGRRWMEGASAVYLLTENDIEVLNMVNLRRVNNDETLARVLYEPNAKVDGRYRRRISRVTERLSQIVLDCTLSSAIDERRRDSILCIRDMCAGATLLRTAAPIAARGHFLDALRMMVYPELSWYAPSVHFALAYHDAVNRRAPRARQSLAKAKHACNQAMAIAELQESWIHLSIPIRRKPEKEAAAGLIKRARLLLVKTAKTNLTGIAGIAAARLASVVSLHTRDISLGLLWLERSRSAQQREGHFHRAAAREYHEQRLFLFNSANDYLHGIAEARKMIALSPEGSVHWFSGTNTLLQLQLKSEQYVAARKTANLVLSQKNLSKQPVIIAGRIRLRALYAQVLTADPNVSMRSFTALRKYPLDAIVLRILLAKQQQRPAVVNKAILSLLRYVERTPSLRSDRLVWLLSKVLAYYGQHGHELYDCRKLSLFRKYEAELTASHMKPTENTVISPLNIWKAIAGIVLDP